LSKQVLRDEEKRKTESWKKAENTSESEKSDVPRSKKRMKDSNLTEGRRREIKKDRGEWRDCNEQERRKKQGENDG